MDINWLISYAPFALITAFVIAGFQSGGLPAMLISRVLFAIAWLLAVLISASYLVTGAPFKHRLIVGVLVGILFGVFLIAIERWMTSYKRKQEFNQHRESGHTERENKKQEIILSLKGLIARANNFQEEYESYDSEMKSKLYASFRNKATEWQKEVKGFITANFPEYYLNTLNLNEDYTLSGIRHKIRILEQELHKLENS